MLFDNSSYKQSSSPFIYSNSTLHAFPYQPLMENRFIIDLIDSGIPSYVMREYRLYNENKEFYLEVNFVELINFVYNPKDIFKIKSVEIKYLDPVGDVMNGLTFQVKDVSFDRNQSYKNYGIQTNKIKFKIVFSSIELLDYNYKKI